MLSPLLNALAAQSLPAERFEVVIVDDCSPDGTMEVLGSMVDRYPYRLRVLRTERNAGAAATRNVGWTASDAPLVAFLDDDVTPTVTWLEEGVAALEDQPDVGVLQGRTTPPEGIDARLLGLGPPDWKIFRSVEGPTPHFEACNIFFRRDALEATGGFEGMWGEDTAAGWKVVQAGWERGFAPRALVTHPVEPRGWRWYAQNGALERDVVGLGLDYPGFRQAAFWRPWAYRREDAAFAAAVLGVLVGTRFRPALLLALPYLWWRRPSVRHRSFFRLCFEIPAVDAARSIGHIRGSIERRALVL
jgi:cellulose synthase/poly-beta-1,6-N-acetylglucosamine synthase-like glycosyltransferase